MAQIAVQAEPFDPGAELSALTQARPDIGGVASFVGQVRELYGGDRITALTLEHYPGMTEAKLAQIAEHAQDRWALLGVRICHRYGRMMPGEPIVFAAAAAGHREPAFQACMFLMDWLKTRAPFWKLEETPEGARWVAARASDDDAAARWARPGEQLP